MAGNARSKRVPGQALKEATDWLILLQETPDDPDVQRDFQAWLYRDPDHERAWEATAHTGDLMTSNLAACRATWQPFLSNLRADDTRGDASASVAKVSVLADAPGRWRLDRGRRRAALALAGAAIAASLIAVVIGPDVMTNLEADYRTDTAEIDTIHLADNSEIILAPQSAVRVTYGATERHVDLLRGEAFFEVAHNAKRPFRVGINDVTVTVVGTGFDIRKGYSRTEVAVAHGVVRVANAPGGATGQSTSPTETLRAGQSVAVSDWGAMTRGILPVSQVAAWRNHQLIAQDQPLGEVVDRLRPYFDGKIFLVDDGLAARPVTGVYNLDDPLQALRGILRAQNARLRQILPWVTIVSAS